jgi:ABC-type polysaccharide/polyol phosphate transport system ATPase subunit
MTVDAVIVDDLWVGYRRTDVGIFRGRRGEPRWGLREVEFSVRHGECLGVIGPNGAGKTTLLQTLAGVLQPTRGRVLTVGRVSSLIELTAGFHRELTGSQNVLLQGVLLGMRRNEVRERLDSIIEFSELEKEILDAPLRMYSAGMGLRLGFALAISMEPSVLLVDEVLAVGDELFRTKCMNRVHELQANGCAVVMVSHDLDLIAKRCDRVGLLESGEMALIAQPAVAIAEYRRRGMHVAPTDATLPGDRRMFRQA